jgi:large subunit ribosomal protein L9
MKIILIKKVEGLGNPGQEKEVKDGYARNYLLKNNLAVLPGDSRAKEITGKILKTKEKEKEKTGNLVKLADEINGKKFTFSGKTDKKGKLYGSMGPKEIAKET